MKKLSFLLLFAALLPLGNAHAETVFLGAFSQTPRIVAPGESGSMTVNVIGIWKEMADSGATHIEVEMPEEFDLTGSVGTPVVSSRINASQYWNYFQGLGTNIYWGTDGDYVCGTNAFDVDPTTGDLYAVMGRGTSSSSSCNTSNRWLVRFHPNIGVFSWIANLGRVNSMEFLGDGRIVTVSATNGPGGRGHIYEVDKTTGAMTARVNPSVGNNYRDVVYNPGDEMLYSIDECYVTRINPADWSFSSTYNSNLCGLRRMSAGLLSDNRILVRKNSEFWELEVNPSNGSIVAVTQRDSHWTSHPRYPMITSLTNAGAVSKSCTSVDGATDTVSCSFGSIGYNTSVMFSIPLSYSIPEDAAPGAYVGTISWYKDTTLLRSVPLRMYVPGDDVKLTMAPEGTNFDVNDKFSVDVEVMFSGRNMEGSSSLAIEVPSHLRVLKVTGSNVCGISRSGVSCPDFSLQDFSSETMTIELEALANGVGTINAKLTVDDVNASNNSSSATIIVGKSADLVATGTALGVGAIDQGISVTVSVANEGPDPASNATLRIPRSEAFELGTATTTSGSCSSQSSGDILCSLGDMAVDAVATVGLSITPKRVGKPVFAAIASSDMADPNSGNNIFSSAVSVTTKPFTVALGEASPTVSSGAIRSVLQLAVTPDVSSGKGVRLTSMAGTMNIKTDGLGLKATVLVYDDRDANGIVDENDYYLGQGSLSAANGAFNVEFDGAISAPTSKTSHFILAVRENGGATVASAPVMPTSRTWTAMGLAGMLPFAFAGFALKRHRALAMVFGLVVGLTACSEELKDLLDNAKVTATVTSIGATLMEDHNAKVDVTGLPISGPTVTLTR